MIRSQASSSAWWVAAVGAIALTVLVSTSSSAVGDPIDVSPLTLISTIQGPDGNDGNGSDVSPLLDERVMVEAIVVGVFLGENKLQGFFVQEEDVDVDNDPRTSEGIFVFYPSPVDGVEAVTKGDKVLLTGIVVEFFTNTQLSSIETIKVLSTNNPLPTPAMIDFQNGNYGVLSTKSGYLADLERFEGMSVRFADDANVVVNELFELARFGELRLMDGGVPIQFSQANFPSATAYDLYLRTVASRQVTLDDGSSKQNPDLSQLPAFDGKFDTETSVRIGDRPTSDLIGCLNFAFDKYRIHPTTNFRFDRKEERPTFDKKMEKKEKGKVSKKTKKEKSSSKKGEYKFAVANVLNYFTTLNPTFDRNGPRGANTPTEFDRQTEKLVTALLSFESDVYGLVEMENNFEVGSPGNAVEFLVSELNAQIGEEEFDWVRPKQDGVVKTVVDTSDLISNAFIYKPSSFTVLGVNILTDSNLPEPFIGPIFDGRSTNRGTLAVTFQAVDDKSRRYLRKLSSEVHNKRPQQGRRALKGEKGDDDDDNDNDEDCITIVLAHLKSKGSVGPGDGNKDELDGAGNNNGIRLLASKAIVEWLKSNPTGIACPNVMIMGDLNAYFKEDPVQYLLNNGFNSLVNEDEGSFIFNGFWGSLDYQLYNDALFDKVKEFMKIKYNSFEANAIDYDINVTKTVERPSTWFDGAVPYRFSDHDPLLSTIKL